MVSSPEPARAGLGHNPGHRANGEVVGPHSGPYGRGASRRVRCADRSPVAMKCSASSGTAAMTRASAGTWASYQSRTPPSIRCPSSPSPPCKVPKWWRCISITPNLATAASWSTIASMPAPGCRSVISPKRPSATTARSPARVSRRAASTACAGGIRTRPMRLEYRADSVGGGVRRNLARSGIKY